MRILIANEARAGGGGVESYLSSLVSPLTARGHAVALLYGNSAAQDGPTTIPLDEAWSVEDIGLTSSLARVSAWKPDVCYSNNMRRLEIDEQLTVAWPTVKMMHGYFGTCVSGHKSFAFPEMRVCSRHCGPACLVHYLPRGCGARRPWTIASQYSWASHQRRLFSRYAAIVVASEHMRHEYLAHGAFAGRVHAIPLFAGGAVRSGRGGSPIDAVFLGRLTALKGGEFLVRAMDLVADRLGRRPTLVMAGEGPERDSLIRLASSLRVTASFPGWVDERMRAELFTRAAVVVIPSVWPEPFGLVGLEAAACGVPAVAFDTGGIPEWLSDEVNGRLVPRSAGAAGLADAIAAIVGDRSYRDRLSAGARAAAARFTSEAHVASLERVLTSACAS
jgi:glycosyltransferase involved in cell wall biosynthesis